MISSLNRTISFFLGCSTAISVSYPPPAASSGLGGLNSRLFRFQQAVSTFLSFQICFWYRPLSLQIIIPRFRSSGHMEMHHLSGCSANTCVYDGYTGISSRHCRKLMPTGEPVCRRRDSGEDTDHVRYL